MLERLRHLVRRRRAAGTKQVRLTREEREERDRVLAHRWERAKRDREGGR